MRDRFPPGVPCWIDTAQPDPQDAVSFYGHLFGWEFEDLTPVDSPDHYFVARLRGRDVAGIGSRPAELPGTPVWSTHVRVDSADDAAARVRDAGGRVLVQPSDVADRGRMATCCDPSGAVFNVWQPDTFQGAELVNEPGTWNWSDLNTRDLEGSKSFYGAVFGWQADTVDLGGLEGTMVRMPGYADFLELRDPGLRQRHADFGAPPGFSDAIGWISVMTSDQFADDVPAHWSVTFAVEDTESIAEAAADLGGTIMVPPSDPGVVRTAVLRDPQGAVFSVNSFDPG